MSLERNLTPKEQREYNEWLAEMQETVRLKPIQQETESNKIKRIAGLKKIFPSSATIISKTLWMPILAGFIKKVPN